MCRISSFHRAALQRVMEVCPELPLGALYNPAAGFLDPDNPSRGCKVHDVPEDFASWFADHQVSGDSVNLRSETISEAQVAEIRRHSKSVMVWFSCACRPGFEDGEAEYRRMMALGADVICCNRPDVLADLLKKESQLPSQS
eukprot:gnl/TRDRNA2_/TRDRNA2_165193_c1_seq3.p1 gnl/TRDRNA2_/TRDRNA2_165193_c1~~gnl/TRDRNA2_/TRDRNA2_165193_c1_seq3.p1  ORF type:complete len:142 (+),score=22.93 gnl/TRDRNA2_/TRDRNA2_165193_c1_seq3:331-756(+)